MEKEYKDVRLVEIDQDVWHQLVELADSDVTMCEYVYFSNEPGVAFYNGSRLLGLGQLSIKDDGCSLRLGLFASEQHQGYGSKALHLLKEYAIELYPDKDLLCTVNENNLASLAIAHKSFGEVSGSINFEKQSLNYLKFKEDSFSKRSNR